MKLRSFLAPRFYDLLSVFLLQFVLPITVLVGISSSIGGVIMVAILDWVSVAISPSCCFCSYLFLAAVFEGRFVLGGYFLVWIVLVVGRRVAVSVFVQLFS